MKDSLHTRLDSAMNDITLSEARKRRILQAAEVDIRPTRPYRGRIVPVIAAICILLCVSALALSPTLRQALEHALGSFAPYTQTVEGVTVTEQGIQVSVLSAIADAEDGIVYLEIQDKTADRLTKDTVLGGVCYARAYDPEQRTLLAQGNILLFMRNGDGTATVEIEDIWGCAAAEGALPPELFYGDNVLESYEAPADTAAFQGDDTTVLKPNQTPMELEWTDLYTLSSVGYDKNGKLHIQIKMAPGAVVPEFEFYPQFHRKVGREMDDYYPPFTGMLHSTVLEDGKYVDFRMDPYEGETFTPEQFQALTITMEGVVGVKERIEGPWTLTFPLDILPEQTISVYQTVSGMEIKNITLSALSLRMEQNYPENGKKGTLAFQPATVYLADGTTRRVERGKINNMEDDARTAICRWRYSEPADPAQVTGVSIGLWMIPIENGTAQPGYWLERLPVE